MVFPSWLHGLTFITEIVTGKTAIQTCVNQLFEWNYANKESSGLIALCKIWIIWFRDKVVLKRKNELDTAKGHLLMNFSFMLTLYDTYIEQNVPNTFSFCALCISEEGDIWLKNCIIDVPWHLASWKKLCIILRPMMAHISGGMPYLVLVSHLRISHCCNIICASKLNI